MRQSSAKPGEQIQCVNDYAATGSLAFDLKFISVALSKPRQFVIRDSEYLPQDADDFVARVGIDHDGEQGGQPCIRWMFGLSIAFRLDLNRTLLVEQLTPQVGH